LSAVAGRRLELVLKDVDVFPESKLKRFFKNPYQKWNKTTLKQDSEKFKTPQA
jgi:hypothetical protein